ncbi:MAG: hypothetical protein WAT12_02445 [Candidatus Nitrotoga sp.]
MNYRDHLHLLTNLDVSEQKNISNKLIETCPFGEWPEGMPASIDPKLILIGVSPGNSPMNENTSIPGNAEVFEYLPCALKSENNHFYYPDSSGYWKKLRLLAKQYCSHFVEDFTENESLSITTHFNLGTGFAGKASKNDVEKDVVEWVSYLLNSIHEPDVVILFGLNSILKDQEVSSWWNHNGGIKVNWSKPDNISAFEKYTNKNLKFRTWFVTNERNKKFQIVIWPNHPSRPPFKNFDIWEESVNEFVNKHGFSA